MVEARGLLAGLVQDGFHALQPFQELPHVGNPGAVIDIHMRDLVIGQGERGARPGIEDLAPVLFRPHGHAARLAQRAIV